jgi:hypothetical protein
LFDKLHLAYFPLKPGSKEPLTSQGFKSSEEEIKLKLKENPNANLAIICGERSGNLAVLDFENEEDAWKYFDKEKILSKTICVKTAHNGIHVYFRTLRSCPQRRTKIAGQEHPLDLCGEGGYIVAPLSVIDHTLCERKKNGVDRCPHAGKSSYYFISKSREIQIVTDLEESVRKRCIELGWLKQEEESYAQGNKNAKFEEIFEKALQASEELRALFEGREIPKTRSEAEYHLIRKLVKAGFSDEQIRTIMSKSQIGKWHEKEGAYKELTIRKARASVLRFWLAHLQTSKEQEEEEGKFWAAIS